MIDKKRSTKHLKFHSFLLFLFLLSSGLLAEANAQPNECIDKADRKAIEIRSFPDIPYLHTIDGQTVLLNEFYAKSLILFPECTLYKKFYYWESETREVVSKTESGDVKHKIRCYHNCRTTFCPDMSDPLKTHGDVAEFYDKNGNFMGLGVYIGYGKYCALPYDGYRK
jgi:hypothetical protein